MAQKPPIDTGIKVFYGIFVLTILIIIVLAYVYYRARQNRNIIINREKVGCPIYTCPGIQGENGAWRTDANGEQIFQENSAFTTNKDDP